MRLLVTGGAGFLGSHLIERLLKMNHDVICVDNLYTGSNRNLDKFKSDSRFEFIRHDVTFPLYVEVDGIFNLACPASPVHYQRHPVATLKTTVQGAINILGLAKRVRARVLQASTSEVYGDPKVTPQSEEYWGNVNPIGIRACYDEGKRAAETLFLDYHREFNVDIRVARIFNTYGPRMALDDGRVVSNFIVQALRNQPITIYGDGSQTRSFCYVDDLIEGMIRLFFTENVHEPINLGNPTPRNMINLANEVIRLTSSQSTLVHQELPLDDPLMREPDISKARKLLNWEPKSSLEFGLNKTIEDFRPRVLGS